MPRLDGVSAAALLARQPTPPAVLMLTTFDADDLVLRALRAGAAGFLLKDTPPAEIVRAIELVAAGDSMLSPAVTRRLIDLVAREVEAGTPPADAARLLAELSPRELEVARAVGRGLSNADISAELHLSVATVKAHVSRLLEKLGVENRVQVALLVRDAALRLPATRRRFEPDHGVVADQDQAAAVGDHRRVARLVDLEVPSCGCGRRCRSSSSS